MTTFLTSILGASWRTTLFGIIQLVAGTFVNYMQSLGAGAKFNWSIFSMQVVMAGALALTKDSKVTGGTIPTGEKPTMEATQKAEAIVAAKAEAKV
jgi:hypothetical protein